MGVKAHQGAITQAWVGFGINWLGEFALTSSNGSYTLGTLSGDLYRLENSGHDLRKYNGQEVRITGRVTPPQPGSSPSNVLDQQYAKLKVQKIKKVFDTCQ